MTHKKQPKTEQVKEPAPKKAVKKKVVKPAAQRVAEVEPIETMPAEPVLVVPAVQLPTPEQHVEPVAPVDNDEAIDEIIRQRLAAAKEAEPEHHEPTKLTLSQRWHNFKNSSWFWVTISVFALIILWALIAEIRRGKINKTLWKTQQTETKITDEKEQLSKTEANLSEMLDIKQKVDSLNIIIDSMQKLASDHAAYEETMRQLNLKYKLRNYELQNQIRTASDDSLRKIVSDLSKQK